MKAEILDKIRNQGVPVSQTTTEYGANAKTICYWLRRCVIVGNKSLILELNHLPKT